MYKKLARNASYNMVYSMLNLVFPLMSSMYIARVLNPTGIGKTAYISSIVAYFVSVAALGMPTYGMREIARHSDGIERERLYTELFVINAVSSLFIGAVYYISVMSFSFFHAYQKLFIIAGSSIFLNAINIDWFYRGIEEYRYITIRNLIIKIISLICLPIFVKAETDLVAYLMISCIAGASNHIFNIVHARKYVRIKWRLIKKRNILLHIKPLLFLFVSLLAGELYSRIDITMLGIMCGDMNVGYYSVAIRIVNIILSIIVSITAAILPQLSKLYSEGHLDVFNKLINEALNILLVLGSAACIGLYFISYDVIALMFGVQFVPASTTLRILSILFLVKGIGDLVAYQAIVAINKEAIFPGIRIGAAILNGVMNYFFIKLFQQNGAAAASVLTELLTLVVVIFLTRDSIHIKQKKNNVISIIIASGLMCVVLYGNTLLSYNSIFKTIISLVVGIIVYGLCLCLCKNDSMRFVGKITGISVTQ